MTPAVYRNEAAGGRFLLTDFDDGHGPFTTAPITGRWKFVFTGQGNTGPAAMFNGAQIDAGFVTWHDDGTELMNSGRAPASGSFCMGVWKHVRGQTYRCSSSDPPTSRTITLDRSQDHYTGSFTLTQDQYDGTNVTDADPKKIAFVVVGVVSATRIEVD